MIDGINTRLMKLYGSDFASRPWFRVVFANDQKEMRHGVFADYCGNIFLREYVGVREVPKYQGIAADCWVLEKLTHGNNPELTDNFSYEPIWVFQDKEGKAVPPRWWAIEMLLHELLYGTKTTPQSEQLAYDNEDKKAIEYFESMIDTSPTESRLNTGEGIVVPANYDTTTMTGR